MHHADFGTMSMTKPGPYYVGVTDFAGLVLDAA